MLKSKNINLKKKHSVNFENLRNEGNLNKNYIWASSTSPLLKIYAPDRLIVIQKNKRYCNLGLFKIKSSGLKRWQKQFKNTPSEILVINKDFPTVSRISFPNHLEDKGNLYILIETNSKDTKFLSKVEIKSLESWLSSVFKNDIRFCDSGLIAQSFNPPMDSYNLINNYFDKIKDNLPVSVPFNYWWPINTTHALKAACEYSI